MYLKQIPSGPKVGRHSYGECPAYVILATAQN